MSSPHRSRRVRIAAVPAAAVLAGAAGAVAAGGGADTTTAVSPRALLTAPARSPVDVPGVAKARAGEPLPAGYSLVMRDVRLTRGTERAYAALPMTCPKGMTWRSGAARGDITVSVLDRVVSKKRSVLTMASYSARATALGETAAGTIYALCR